MRVIDTIHPTVVIGEGVRLGTGLSIGPYAVLVGPLVVGDGAWIGAGAQIGAPPEITSLRQNVAWAGDLEHAGVEIGPGAVIRENVVIHQGSKRTTSVGARSWILNSAYLAHDVQVGPDATVSAGVTIGGHASIGARANIGMNATIHQGRVVGSAAMVGMGTPVSRDVPPFTKAFGTPPRIRGINRVGLERMGYSPELSHQLESAIREGDLLFERTTGLEALQAEIGWWKSCSPTAPMQLALTREGMA